MSTPQREDGDEAPPPLLDRLGHRADEPRFALLARLVHLFKSGGGGVVTVCGGVDPYSTMVYFGGNKMARKGLAVEFTYAEILVGRYPPRPSTTTKHQDAGERRAVTTTFSRRALVTATINTAPHFIVSCLDRDHGQRKAAGSTTINNLRGKQHKKKRATTNPGRERYKRRHTHTPHACPRKRKGTCTP